MANPTVLVSLVQLTTWGGRTCHRDEGEGLNLKHEALTRPMKSQELHLGSGGPHQGPGGAVSGTLATGLGLTISLDPAVGDLLAEPNSLRKGTNLLKVSIILLTLSKNDASTETVVDGGGGNWLQLKLYYIIDMLKCLQFL